MHTVPSQKEYYDDLRQVLRLSHDPAAKSYSYQRLELLASRFNLHVTLNEKLESAAQRESFSSRLLQRAKSRYTHPSLCMHESKTFTTIHKAQTQALSQ